MTAQQKEELEKFRKSIRSDLDENARMLELLESVGLTEYEQGFLMGRRSVLRRYNHELEAPSKFTVKVLDPFVKVFDSSPDPDWNAPSGDEVKVKEGEV